MKIRVSGVEAFTPIQPIDPDIEGRAWARLRQLVDHERRSTSGRNELAQLEVHITEYLEGLCTDPTKALDFALLSVRRALNNYNQVPAVVRRRTRTHERLAAQAETDGRVLKIMSMVHEITSQLVDPGLELDQIDLSVIY